MAKTQIDAYTPKELLDFADKVNFFTPILKKHLKVVKNVSKNPIVQKTISTIDELLKELNELSLSMSQDPTQLERKMEQCQVLCEHIRQNLQVLYEQLKTQKISESIALLQDNLNMIFPSNNFLVRPVGIKEISWLVTYRLQESLDSLEANLQTEVKTLLHDLVKVLSQYEEGKITAVDKMVSLTEQFMQKHPDQMKRLNWVEGIYHEAKVIQKRHEAVKLREELDSIYIELLGKKNQIEIEHARSLKDLAVKYKISQKPAKTEPKSGVGKTWANLKKGLSYFNIAKDMRQAKYLKEKAKLNLFLNENLKRVTLRHQEKYADKIKALQGHFQKIEEEVMQMDSRYVNVVVMPLSFQSHRTIKELVDTNGGIMVGGLAQNKVVGLGSSNGLCYGFTKAWVLLMNTLREKQLEDYEIIDALNFYGKKSEEVKHRAISEVNALVLNEEVYKYHDDQHRDRVHNKPELKKEVAMNRSFAAKALATLQETSPPSLIISLSSEKGGHAMGLVKTNHGIWFHDSNYTCVYFPFDKEGEMEKHCVNFLENYLKTFYPKYTKGQFIALSHSLDPKLIKAHSYQHNWSPSFLLSKQIQEKSVLKTSEISQHRKASKLQM